MLIKQFAISVLAALTFFTYATIVWSDEPKNYRELIFDTGNLKPVDSILNIKIGDLAPDFTLPSIQGEKITLSQFKGSKNIVLSFVPAAWTPVCSDQWPGYVFARQLFEAQDAIILGITVDNIPTLHAWTRQMGEIWFPVLSDFWPHGAVANIYGVLRSDGTTERALIIIDKQGIIRNILVQDINKRPPLDFIVNSLNQINNK
jgi:peroxiredoxin